MAILSSKNQITIPVDVMRETGLAPGDAIEVRADGPGRVELIRAHELVDELAGVVGAETYASGYLRQLRSEWE